MRRLLILTISFLLIGTTAAAAQTLDEVATDLDETGRFVEFELDADTSAAIDRANSNGIAFVWLDQGGTDAEQVAEGLAGRLDALGSRYGSLVVLNNDDFWVLSRGENGAAAADASRGLFASGAIGAGLDAVTDTIVGAVSSESPSTTVQSGESGTSTDSSGGGFPWFWTIVLAVLGFLGFRYLRGRSTAKKLAAQEIETDRAEIQEQLRNNADRVIDLGDKVIATGDGELIRIYEQASASYQDVSTSIDEAVTADEIDALDDKIDEAEWQFEVIEARLEGRTPPPRPAPDADDAIAPPSPSSTSTSPAPPSEGPTANRVPPLGRDRNAPALGRDESVFDGPGRPAARQRRTPTTRRSSRRGGMGGMGGMLGSVLGSIVLGGGRRRSRGGGLGGALGGVLAGQQSRRSQRRSGGSRSSGGGLTGGGGLGSLSGRTSGRTSGGGRRDSGWSGGGGSR